MAELETSRDPGALVPGAPEAMAENARVLAGRADTAERTGEGLARIDVGAWSGSAADAFEHRFNPVPGRWFAAADSLRSAADALDGYVSTFQWARGQASHAVAVWDQGQEATGVAVAAHAKAMAAFMSTASQHEPAPVFIDPGEELRQAAREILSRARIQLTEVGEDAAKVLRAETALAPHKSDWLDNVKNFLADVGTHAVNSLASWGNAIMHHPGEAFAVVEGALLTSASAVGEGFGLALAPEGVGVGVMAVSTAGLVTGGAMLTTAMDSLSQHATGDDRVEAIKPGNKDVTEKIQEVKRIITDEDGNWIGVKGNQKDTRLVTQEEMNQVKQKIMDSFGESKVKIASKGKIEVWVIDGKSNITFRSFSDTGGDTIDLNDLEGIEIGRIHIDGEK